MRNFVQAAAITAAAFLATSAAHAEPLPALTVPTFSLEFTNYSAMSDYAPGPAAIGLVSTDAASTVISLDSFGQALHTQDSGSNHALAEVISTIRFAAASGYRITGISFSATVYGVLELPEVSGPNIVGVDYGDSLNFALAKTAIAPIGVTQQATQLYYNTQVTAPVTLGGIVQNTEDLRAFDFDLMVFGSSRAEATYVYFTNPNPNEPWPLEGKAWGNAEIHYVNPVLTVYTESAGPVAAVPEPGQWAMMAAGLLLLAGARRFKRR